MLKWALPMFMFYVNDNSGKNDYPFIDIGEVFNTQMKRKVKVNLFTAICSFRPRVRPRGIKHNYLDKESYIKTKQK